MLPRTFETFWKLSCPSNVAGVWALNHSDPLGSIASRWHHQLPLRRRDQGIHQFFQTCACTKVHWVEKWDWQYLFVFCHKRKNQKQNDKGNFLKKPTQWQVPEKKNDEETQTNCSRGIRKELAILLIIIIIIYYYVSGWSGKKNSSIAA